MMKLVSVPCQWSEFSHVYPKGYREDKVKILCKSANFGLEPDSLHFIVFSVDTTLGVVFVEVKRGQTSSEVLTMTGLLLFVQAAHRKLGVLNKNSNRSCSMMCMCFMLLAIVLLIVIALSLVKSL